MLTSSDFLSHAVVGMIPTETVAKRLPTLPTQNAVTGPVPDLLSTNTSIILRELRVSDPLLESFCVTVMKDSDLALGMP